MKKNLFLLLLLLAGSQAAMAQSTFFNYGYSIGYGKSIAKYYPRSTQPAVDSNFVQPTLMTFGASVGVTSILKTLGAEKSLGIQADLNIAASLEFMEGSTELLEYYVVNLPVFAQYNYGNFSSVDSEMDYGFAFGAGANLNYMLKNGQTTEFTVVEPVISPYVMVTPAVRFSFRWWSKANRLTELNLTATSTPKLELGNYADGYSRNLFLLSYVFYPNY